MTAAGDDIRFPGSEGVPDRVFHAAYRSKPAMWRTGAPQTAVLEGLSRGWFSSGRLLDAGCGSGENTVEIARSRPDLQLAGWDLVPEAIALARLKSRLARVEDRIEFKVFDLRLATDGTTFDDVLDAGVLHLFSDADRSEYLDVVRSLVSPGGWFTTIVFRDDETRPGGPRRMAKDELANALENAGFRIASIEPTVYDTRAHEGGARAWLGRARADS